MIFVNQNDPILLPYQNELACTITEATLQTTQQATLTQVTPFFCKIDGRKREWYAVFDPTYFKVGTSYQIQWTGTNTNGDRFSELETGIEVSVTADFYSEFLHELRRSMFDDGAANDYPPVQLVDAVKYAISYINAQAPITQLTLPEIPYNLLLDFSKIYLYRGKASREAMETFSYNDIGKSFNIDRSPKLLSLADNLSRTADAQLVMFKKQMRPWLKGIQSRYARRSGASTRTQYYSSVIYRNYTR